MFKNFKHGSVTVLQQENDNIITFGGNNDRLAFLLPLRDTIIAKGHHQTLALNKVGDGVVADDRAHDLNIELFLPFSPLTVLDFQNDSAGHVTLLNQFTVTIAPDSHGGTLVSLLRPGLGAGPGNVFSTIDFVGDDHVTMDQIKTV